MPVHPLAGTPEPVALLVVDDDDAIRRNLRRILEGRFSRIHEAASGDDALERMSDDREIELVISDIHMQGHDGLWLLQKLQDSYPGVGVIMLTGDAEVATAVECLKSGAMDYLTKPMLIGEVQARVDKALEKHRLMQEVTRLQENYKRDLELQVADLSMRNERMFLAQVQMAVRMLEAKDPYTRGHSERVAKYSDQVARQLGLPDNILSEIELGGELHDIGKIGTRDAVLNKAGRLTEEEFGEMRRHTIDGEEMLSVLRDDHPVALNIVRSHHERLDGSGFPDGLVGDAIPLPTRIVAVADAYDAMTTTRAYREKRDPAWAIGELQRFRDFHFDGQVIDAFIATGTPGI